MDKPKTVQLNRIKIVPFLKGDVIQWHFRCIAPDGRVLEEFASQSGAISFASQTKDFLAKRKPFIGLASPREFWKKTNQGLVTLPRTYSINGYALSYSYTLGCFIAMHKRTKEIALRAQTANEVYEFAKKQSS